MLHEKYHIVHRDIKPENILLSAAQGVKITDLGIAVKLENQSTEMHGLSAAGTLKYIAPELLCKRITSYRGDVYQLGLIIYELVVGDKIWS